MIRDGRRPRNPAPAACTAPRRSSAECQPRVHFGPHPGEVGQRTPLQALRGAALGKVAAEGLEWRPLHDFTGVWTEVDTWLTLR